MTFSVAVPLFNHGAFVGATIDSVLAQSYEDWELLVSDNASTDNSRAVVAAREDDPRVQVASNRYNLGFAANLDRAVALGSAEHVILLSSDDLVEPTALERYAAVLEAIGPQRAANAVVISTRTRIDEHGAVAPAAQQTKPQLPAAKLDAELTAALGVDVRAALAPDVLADALRRMRNPLPFLTTCYPRQLWEDVGGYRGGRLLNPDKWFAWRLLSVASEVIAIDEPLFQYRVHSGNQEKIRQSVRTLRHAVDDYYSVLETDDRMLKVAGLTRDELLRAYLREDISKRAAVFAVSGNALAARRYRRFGASIAGLERWRDPWWWIAGVLVVVGPVIGPALRPAVQRRTSRSFFHSAG